MRKICEGKLLQFEACAFSKCVLGISQCSDGYRENFLLDGQDLLDLIKVQPLNHDTCFHEQDM